ELLVEMAPRREDAEAHEVGVLVCRSEPHAEREVDGLPGREASRRTRLRQRGDEDGTAPALAQVRMHVAALTKGGASQSQDAYEYHHRHSSTARAVRQAPG